MGVGADRRRPPWGQDLATGGWILATALSAAGPPLAPPQAMGLMLAGLLALVLAWRLPGRGIAALPAAMLAVASAPLWLAGAGLVGSAAVTSAPMAAAPVTTAPPWVVQAAVQALAIGLCVAGGGALPRPVRWGLLGLGALLGLRALLVAGQVPGAPPLAAALVLAGVLVCGCAALPARGLRLAALVLILVAGVHLGRGWPTWSRPPTTPAQVRVAAAMGALPRHQEALAADPALGLLALGIAPSEHGLAALLEREVGTGRLLDAGWRPEGAPLSPVARREVGQDLDRRGRGGEALRLLWRGRADPEVAWTWLLLARDQGVADLAPPALGPVRPPAGTPSLDGALDLSWTFLTAQERSLDLDLPRAASTLELRVRGQAWRGPPALEVAVDDAPPTRLELAEGPGSQVLAGPFAPGPHRLRVRFVNDLLEPEGDRNAWVDGLRAR